MSESGEEKAVVPSKDEADQAIILSEAEMVLAALQEEHGTTWDSVDDPRDPYNWSSTRKVSIAIIVSCGQLVTLMSTSMMAAALDQISEDLHIRDFTTQVCFSIFILGLAFAPFLIAALSEIYGRKPVWLVCNAWYILFNSLCPVGKSSAMMIIGRFMAGSGASVGTTLTGPIMADMYRAKDRGKSLAIASMVPYLGPALGPIIGGLISQHVKWPWLFWTLSLFDAGISLLGGVIITESYTPVLLRHKAVSENPALYRPENPLTRQFYSDLSSKLRVGLYRPLNLLVTRPIIQIISFTFALAFGIYCLMLSTYAELWIERYHESESISSLNYISIGLGISISAQAGGYLMDWIWKRLRARPGSVVTPEFRIPYLAPAALLLPAGLFWYGWSAENRSSWVLVDAGAAIFTCGNFMVAQGLLAYLLDEFKHAASANAASRMLSYIIGFAFPLFGPKLYDQLGYGWGNSLLAFLYIALGMPAPLILWLWGAKLRAIGRQE
ncbi:putative efflux pump antibiotic resistance protein [Xylogone sp. PMI_703]|nr:putative efflux pump antibiotic resistance protein [Xylogone sp. PMI_703]